MTSSDGRDLARPPMREWSSRAREMAKVPMEAFLRRTGVRPSLYVAGFLAEDIAALAKDLASPRSRRTEVAEASKANTAEECFAFARAYFGVGPVQHFPEIKALLDLARSDGAQSVCEIGCRDAGTSILFSRVVRPETLIVMDLYAKNRWRLRRDAPPGQIVHVIDGDTAHPLTVQRLRRKLRGRKLDLLLIDGDHGWRGVRQDFLNYRQFVRDDGLIAFHDICEVTDPDSGSWTGDVPAFWKLVRTVYPAQEFIATPGQQGLGIGVIRYDPAVSISPILAAETPPPP